MTITKKWIQSIGKKDFIPSSNSRICSKHFMQEDFKKTSNDSNVRRRKNKKNRNQKEIVISKCRTINLFGTIKANA